MDFDTRLMLQVQQGDAASFERLLQRHNMVVLQHCAAWFRMKAIAEELVQDVFVRVPCPSYLCTYREIQHLAVPHSHQRRAEPFS